MIFLPKRFPIKKGTLLPNNESNLKTMFLPKNIAYLLSYFLSQHCLYHISLAAVKSTMFNFCVFPSQIKFFCILYKQVVVSLLIFVVNKRCITLETGKDLKTVILPSRVNCLMRHNFILFSILTKCLEEFLSC